MEKLLTLLLCFTLIGCSSTQPKQTDEQTEDPTVYLLSQVEANAKPVIKIFGKHPQKAYEEKIEGWVKMSAVVTENGGVTQIKVLDSHPKGIFEKSAQRSFSKWKYIPALLNGKTVKVYR